MNLKTRVKKLFKSKDSRVLLENFISLSTLEFIGIILPLITLPYVLRVVGFSNYGIIVLAASLIAYFQSVTDYSFKITATRDVAVFRGNKKKLNLIYSKVIIVKALFFLLSVIIISTIVFLYEPFYEERLVFFLTLLILFGHAVFPEWFFQGIEEMKYITLLNSGAKIFFAAGVFIFINDVYDYWIYPLLHGGGWVVGGLIGQILLIKKYKLKLVWVKPRIIKNTIIDNYPIFVNQFFPTLYNNTSTFLLGILTTTNLVGVYDAIKKIVDLCNKLLKVLSRVFFPFLNRRKNMFMKYNILVSMISISMVIGVISLHKFIFWYLNINHPNALVVLIILALGIIGLALYDIYGLNYFIVRRKDKFVMKNTIYASLIGLILSFPLIYTWGITGAAINLSLSRFLMGGILMFKYQKINKRKVLLNDLE